MNKNILKKIKKELIINFKSRNNIMIITITVYGIFSSVVDE